MLVGRSAPPALAVPHPDREILRPLLRALILGAALGLGILVLSRAESVGAQAPANCIPINQTSCFSNGVIYTNGVPTANIGQPNSVVVPGYVVPSYVAPSPYYGGYVAPNYFSPYYGGFYGGYYNNFYSENIGYLGTNCDPRAWWCLNYEYTGDVFANLFAPPGAPTSPPSAMPGGTTPAPYRTAAAKQPAPAVTNTTVTAAPVAQSTPVAAPAPAPATQTATALSAPAQAPVAASGGSGVHVLSVQQPATAPVATSGADDHRG